METLMNMSLGDITKYAVGIIAALSMFIEFTPIKVNPISAILNWIGKRTNREIYKDIETLKKTINAISKKQEEMEQGAKEREAINCRVRILRFSDELRRGVKHSQESFEQALADVDVYEKYCREHPDFKNNKTVVASNRIKSAYETHLEMNDFL